MNTWVIFAAAMALAVTAIAAGAQSADTERAQKPVERTGQPDAATQTKPAERVEAPAASAPTGGDEKPNAVDPAEATKTGGNAGEGASYSRSNEKGESTTR